MKEVILLILAFFSLFSTQKHTLTSPAHYATHNTTTTQIASNAGQESGTNQCTANHIDPTDPQAYLPNANCTPGVTNPEVTQATISSTIRVSGYTKTIRPPASYTDQLKREQIQQYGYTDTNTRDYEEDHFISLELGGNPTDPKNLWPEPHPSTNEKDLVENYLHKQICDGTMTLAQAQKEITQNWYAVYQKIK
jgi:hypothetical protein